MKNNDLHQLFVDELADMLSSEHQIIKALPNLIKIAAIPDLKKALSDHLKETEHQAERIKKIFSILGLPVKENKCDAMEGLLSEADEIVKGKPRSALLDAAIISAAQKVEHYEIASYGTLKSFAKHLQLGREVIDLIQESLDEEGGADKKLTKIADGGFFTSGVNQEAVEEEKHATVAKKYKK